MMNGISRPPYILTVPVLMLAISPISTAMNMTEISAITLVLESKFLITMALVWIKSLIVFSHYTTTLTTAKNTANTPA